VQAQIKSLLTFLSSPKAEKISFDSELNLMADVLPRECAALVKNMMVHTQLAADLEAKKTFTKRDLDRYM
jgi:hypothetical protein